MTLDLAHLPADDPGVYAMLRAADTVGVFQVESRAQMATLPRNAPERFYDLVVEVAIIRPGPIIGDMVHPFFERRLGREPVTYSHPCLEPILARTLGVPLFQEQLLRMAMAVAGFSGGEAEELRRAMGFKRSVERMAAIERRLRAGMAERGIAGETQDRIVQSITSFALYGFPESHAASFALIAYATAYLKRYHPTAFLIALLNAWPMGFYHPATLVKDAQRHGVTVLPIDVHHSDWRCKWEERTEPDAANRRQGRPDLPAEEARGPRLHQRGATTVGERGPSAGGRPPLSDLERPPVPEQGDPGGRRDHERRAVPPAAGACRIGLRYVAGLRQAVGERIAGEAQRRPFTDLDDLKRRAGASAADLERLAEVGALASLGMSRRTALWQASLAARPVGELFTDGSEASERARPVESSRSGTGGRSRSLSGGRSPAFRGTGTSFLGESSAGESLARNWCRPPLSAPQAPSAGRLDRPGSSAGVKSPLPEMSREEETRADFAGTGMTVGPHPVAYVRAELDRRGVISTADLPALSRGTRTRIAGAVIVRQRPGTAKGALFLTVEDETGMAQAIVSRGLLAAERATIVGHPGLIVEGTVESRDGSVSLRAERFWPLADLAAVPSHDFR